MPKQWSGNHSHQHCARPVLESAHESASWSFKNDNLLTCVKCCTLSLPKQRVVNEKGYLYAAHIPARTNWAAKQHVVQDLATLLLTAAGCCFVSVFFLQLFKHTSNIRCQKQCTLRSWLSTLSYQENKFHPNKKFRFRTFFLKSYFFFVSNIRINIRF